MITARDFGGRVALVTGAAHGIGKALCLALRDAGATVVGLDVAPVTGILTQAGVEPLTCDVTSDAEVQQAVSITLGTHGTIDFAVACAGITRDHVLWRTSSQDWRQVLEVNLTGAFHLFRAACEPMRRARFGRLVAVSSINGMRGKAGQANYSASKAGLIGLVRTAAKELGRRHVTANAVAPGWVDTRMTRDLPDRMWAAATAESCTGQLAEPNDIAAAVMFLLSDEARLVTGQEITVDGGQGL
jgi:NAD(P)-dependent dehydrogenase (short-subunit alcohol dehydrogenase family)